MKVSEPNPIELFLEVVTEDSDQSEAKKSREAGIPKRPHNAFFYYSQEKRPK